MELEKFSNLIAAFYSAAMVPEGWQDLARIIASAFETEGCALQVCNLAQGQSTILGATDNFDARARHEYENYYHKIDLFVPAFAARIGDALIASDVVSDASLLKSEVYNDYCKRLEIFHTIGSIMPLDGMSCGVVGIYRDWGQKGFDEGDKRQLNLILPHLKRAMQLQIRLAELHRDRGLSHDALNAVAVGVLAVSSDGRLLFANAKADRLLSAGRGLTVSHGRVHAQDHGKDGKLAQLVRNAALAAMGQSKEAGGVLALSLGDGAALSLLVSPLPPEAVPLGTPQTAALIFISDSRDKANTSAQGLIALYGLTPAEARLTQALLKGHTLQDYADRAGLSLHTVKTQIKQVFAKTGTGRQAELVLDLLRNPVLSLANR